MSVRQSGTRTDVYGVRASTQRGEHDMAQRYAADRLAGVASQLFERAGLDADKAQTTARILVEADLMGHSTHGLAQAGAYLEEIEAGRTAKTGEPAVITMPEPL